jgi:hypothetical protein
MDWEAAIYLNIAMDDAIFMDAFKFIKHHPRET